uniref:Uncharacterized protein n=1 Tax=Salix viminalis TaxID=40686 RepID=A0A6N2MS55_SALVM
MPCQGIKRKEAGHVDDYARARGERWRGAPVALTCNPAAMGGPPVPLTSNTVRMGTKDRVLIIDTVTVGRGKNMFTVESGEDDSVGSNSARVLDQWDPLIGCHFLHVHFLSAGENYTSTRHLSGQGFRRGMVQRQEESHSQMICKHGSNSC